MQVTDHLGRVYTTQYDLLNRVTRQIALGADTARYTYADLLRSTQFIDPQGNTYTTQRNAAGWVISTTDPRGSITTRGYDRRGNVVRATDRRGQVVRWFKDRQDRDTLRVAGADTTRYAYDPTQRWVTVRNAESTDTLFVDAAGRPTSATTVRGGYRYVLSQGWEGTQAGELNIRAYQGASSTALWSRMSGSGYDGMRREARLQDFGGQATTTTFDATERARTVTLPNASTVRSNVYDARGALTNETYSGGAAASFTRAHWRDHADRIAATVRDGPPIVGADQMYPSTNQFQRGHDYDSRDRLVAWRDIQSYEYTTTQWIPWDPYDDCPGCMILESTAHAGVDTLRAATYAYDQLGNRTGAGIAYQAGNGSRLAQMNGETFTYDAEGNVTQRTGAAGTSTYTWDALGQLRTVVTPQGTTTYGYDGLGQRVRKTVNGSLETKYLLHDGQVVMELGAGNYINAEYTYYPGTDRPHGLRREGVQYYYTQDAQGNVTGLVNASGNVAETYEYTPYGELIATTNSVANPYRYKGREWDAAAGLYFMRARYYDPTLGRFISEDPIGRAGGVNPFAFVGGDPVNFADPSGLAFAYLEREGPWDPCSSPGGFFLCNGGGGMGFPVPWDGIPRDGDNSLARKPGGRLGNPWLDSVRAGCPVLEQGQPSVPGRLTSAMGMRIHPVTGLWKFHAGDDFHADLGTRIVSQYVGRVGPINQDSKTAGKVIFLEFDNGYRGNVMHLSRIDVVSGQRITLSTTLGLTGESGIGNGPHLHRELRTPSGKVLSSSTCDKAIP